MKISTTPFEGLVVLEPIVFKDQRGYFFEAFSEAKLIELGIDCHFVQDNQSYSGRGVIRGLHFQNAPCAQTKLVRVLAGVILDVVVDLRKGQPTFGQWHAVELSEENRKQILVPKGFAHGFSVLSKEAVVMYKCDALYAPACEGGVRLDDPDLAIDWQIANSDRVISGKDLALP